MRIAGGRERLQCRFTACRDELAVAVGEPLPQPLGQFLLALVVSQHWVQARWRGPEPDFRQLMGQGFEPLAGRAVGCADGDAPSPQIGDAGGRFAGRGGTGGGELDGELLAARRELAAVK